MESLNHHILFEHSSKTLTKEEIDCSKVRVRKFKTERGQDYFVLKKSEKKGEIHLNADYFIGVDWLVEGSHSVQVEPKINTRIVKHFDKQLKIEDDEAGEIEEKDKAAKDDISNPQSKAYNVLELDYLKMLLEVMAEPKTAREGTNLVFVDWKAPQIQINQNKDRLTPFLVIQFLLLLQTIVRKGLKKSYYKKQNNLGNRVKGKILVGQQIKQNVFKNRLTSTYCEYQVFGVDNLENRFLKKVMVFASSYVENNSDLFKGNKEIVEHLIRYCRPAFEQLGEVVISKQLFQFKHNPFFKEYKEAIKIGEYILKKFAYNISKTTEELISTPPFWIDMPKLFELSFFVKILKSNPQDVNHIHFQFSTYGNSLDFLVSKKHFEMVIDTKYKLYYQHNKVHQDIRQVSGYARLKKVISQIKRENDNWNEDSLIDCLIVYPDIEMGIAHPNDFRWENMVSKRQPITAYQKVYKLGIKLPLINTK